MRVFCALTLLLVTATLLAASGKDARRLFAEGRKAERAGDAVRAYLLYSQAVAQDPNNLEYWLRRQAVRARAVLQPKPVEAPMAEKLALEDTTGGQPVLAREPQPPLELKASPERRNLDLRGDAKTLFTEVARAYRLNVLFDPDYQPGPPLRFRLENADYREALHALESATASFVVPAGERLLRVFKDTPPKRNEEEPVATVTVPVPELVSLQDAQEVMRSVQQVMGLRQTALDSRLRVIVARDRLSMVRPAQALIAQLLGHRAMVSIEVEFVEDSRVASTSYGVSLQTLLPLVDFGKPWNSAPSIPASFTRFLTFGGGGTFLGLGLMDAQLFARMSSATSRTLYRAEIRSLDGQPASLHVGDQYPILTGRYIPASSSDQLSVPPTINFEDLGLVIKVTPRVNGIDEMTLDLDLEFKALTPQVFNDVPVISNRSLQSDVRLRLGEWAVVAGLMSVSQARTISGLAGLSRIPLAGPLFRQNTRDDSESQVLVIIKPSLLSLPPSETVAPVVPVGTDQRPRIPL
jgi:general secretion pathway protein D